MVRRLDRRLGAVASMLLAAAASAQQGAANLDFRTGDGSRFVLVADAAAAAVNWAIATPAGSEADPPGMDGMAAALVEASLNGTWRTGTADPAAERAALQALDRAIANSAALPRDSKPPTGPSDVDRAGLVLQLLGDPQAFRRVLAAVPAVDLEVSESLQAAVLTLTTTAASIEAVGRLLVERREQFAMRGAFRSYITHNATSAQIWDADPFNQLRAEAAALAFPGLQRARAGQRPVFTVPTLAAIEECWHSTQRPDRSVHVLVGNFEPATVRSTLERIFAVTALPAWQPRPEGAPRPLGAVRRSVVPGLAHPACVLAWQLPDAADATVGDVAAHWLASGGDSWLHRELQRAGRAPATSSARSPWPPGPGPALFVVEVSENKGDARTLADVCLQLCRKAGDTPPTAAELERVQAERLQTWEAATRDGHVFAQQMATRLLDDPKALVGPPTAATAEDVQRWLRELTARNPVVIEGRAP
jgi:predicted Zn-dependent peptidase